MTAAGTIRILVGMGAGLALGILAGTGSRFIPAAQLIGGLWLDALRMTVVPLVFALIVTGIAGARTRTGAVTTRRALGVFLALLVMSSLFGLAFGDILLSGWHQAGALVAPHKQLPTLPTVSDAMRALIPANPIGAAAQGAIVPVVIFALFFGFALGRIEATRAHVIGEVIAGLADVMIVIVNWVLLLAPVGVFALAFAVAAETGFAVGAALGWYVLVQIITTLALALAIYGAVLLFRRAPLLGFARAVAPAQMVAFATQSSLATLPAMLNASRALGLAPARSDTVLSMAVALFRIAAPASIVIVTLTLAQLNGVVLQWPQLAIIGGMAVVNTLTIAGLPNQITFFAAYAPPAIAVGVPIELLPLMLAIDAIPDMVYTLTNVTADIGVATLLSGHETAQPKGAMKSAAGAESVQAA